MEGDRLSGDPANEFSVAKAVTVTADKNSSRIEDKRLLGLAILGSKRRFLRWLMEVDGCFQ